MEINFYVNEFWSLNFANGTQTETCEANRPGENHFAFLPRFELLRVKE